MKDKGLLFNILVILGLAVSLPAQDRLRFKRISLEAGLSQSSIFTIAQDQKGFIWFGTESGLNRYDGYQFKIYMQERGESNGLCNSYVWSLFVDSKGSLWVGTDNGLDLYIEEKDHFIPYLHDPNSSTSLSNNRIFALYEDASGSLWVGTDGGLNRLDRATNRFTRFMAGTDDVGSLSHNYVRAILQDHEGFIWVGTDGGGLNRLNLKTGKFEHFRHSESDPDSISNDSVLALYEDRQGDLWVGTKAGLNRFDSNRRKWAHYRHSLKDNFSLSDDWVNCIYRDRSGVLWIGTNQGGVNQYLPEKNGFINFRYNPDDETSLSSDRIITILEDYSDNIWFGTYGGISKFHRNMVNFKLYQAEQGNPNSLSNNDVRQIYKESQDILWVATDGGGLNRLDRAAGKVTHFTENPADPQSISSNRVFSIFKDRSGTYWITTATGGLNRFDPVTGKFVRYRNDPRNPNSLSNNFVRTIVEDRKGYLWLGTDGGSLNRFDNKSGLCKRYLPDPDNPNSLSFYRIYSLYYDKADILWIGTYGGGLNRFDPATETFKVYKYDPKNPKGIKDDYILCIHEDSRGNLWLGTSAGLARFDRQKEVFHFYTEKDGLPDRVIYAIVEDNNGNLWVTTNRGLSRFNPVKEKFKNFDIHDGLQSYEFSTYSYCKGYDGELFFGGVKGFNSFYPDEIKDNPHIPPVVLTRFQLFNQDVPIGRKVGRRVILDKAITDTENITLSSGQNVFSFEYSALDYIAPEKNQYAYMMVGLDKTWNFVGNRRFVAYAGIPPGKYTFKVKGSNNDGVWNESGVSLRIAVMPPFWKTIWFIFLCGVLAVSTAVTFFLRRISRLTRRQRELENLVASRTQELKEISLKDPLTGLRNRRFLREVLGEDIENYLKKKCYLLKKNAKRRQNDDFHVYGVMMVDIDYFKTLNDEFGHDIGDKWLVQFSKIMKAHLRSDDEVIRYGGEEFLIILRNVDPAFLPAIAVKLKEALNQIDKEMKNPQMKRTCSIGYSQFPFYNDVPMHLSFEEVVLLADLALYYAKKNGRNMAVQLVSGEAKPDREQTEKMTTSLEFGIANRFYLIHPLR